MEIGLILAGLAVHQRPAGQAAQVGLGGLDLGSVSLLLVALASPGQHPGPAGGADGGRGEDAQAAEGASGPGVPFGQGLVTHVEGEAHALVLAGGVVQRQHIQAGGGVAQAGQQPSGPLLDGGSGGQFQRQRQVATQFGHPARVVAAEGTVGEGRQ